MKDRPAFSSMRAIRGPIMVITVGVLFAIGNFTPYGFDQTWPVLIIVAGLVSLLGRGPHVPPQAPPPPPFTTYHPPVPPVPPPVNPGGYRQTPYSQPPIADPNQGDRR
jgi:hypothetical protein